VPCIAIGWLVQADRLLCRDDILFFGSPLRQVCGIIGIHSCDNGCIRGVKIIVFALLINEIFSDVMSSFAAALLEQNFSLPIGESFHALSNDPDVIDQLLKDTCSAGTRRVYQADIKDFFVYSTGREPDRSLVLEFLHLEQRHAVAVVLWVESLGCADLYCKM
jgi:hypothetical protein